MGLNLNYQYGQTPIDEEEKEGIRIRSITTQSELNEIEQKNIEQALQWAIGKRFTKEKILSEKFIRTVHKKMYGDVWKWAGEFRKSEKNIGIEFWKIPSELKLLLDDTLFWIENKTYPPDEIAIRFKHRLVSIHCFPNGNGRHSRFMADLIVEKLLQTKPFSWGQSYSSLSENSDARSQYLKAIKEADQGNYSTLLRFARS